MQIEYAMDSRPALRLYVDRKNNRVDFARHEAESIAQEITRRGGYARVLLGGNVFSSFGEDPRHV